MDKAVAVTQLCEYYGIPPQHNSGKRGDITIIKNIEGAFNSPLEDVEKQLKFDQVKHFWDNQTRRIGKDVSALVKQITR